MNAAGRTEDHARGSRQPLQAGDGCLFYPGFIGLLEGVDQFVADRVVIGQVGQPGSIQFKRGEGALRCDGKQEPSVGIAERDDRGAASAG